MKHALTLAATLALSAPALAESRSVLVVLTHDTDGKAKVAIHSDDKQDRTEAATVDAAVKAVARMKGWGSAVSVYVVTDQRMSRKDRKALFDAIDGNIWLDLSYYGPEAPKNLAEHFLKAEETSDWQTAEVIAFADFDDLQVRLVGKARKAFLVGLQPLGGKAEKVRKDVLAKLQKNALSVRVVTTRGEAVGLSVDAFMHHTNDFDHPWDPQCPYCWSGWGACNLNTWFLSMGLTRVLDNFGRNDRYREQFLAAAKTIADTPLRPEAILKKKFEGEATVEFTAAKSAQLVEGLSLKPGESASLYLAPMAEGKTGSRVYVIVNWTVATRLRQLGIDDPAGHFRDKLIRVSGAVKQLSGGNIPGERSLYTTDGGFKSETVTSGKEPEYYVVVESLDQINLVRKP